MVRIIYNQDPLYVFSSTPLLSRPS